MFDWKALLSSFLSQDSSLAILFGYTCMENVLFNNPNKNLVYVHVSTHVLGIWEVSHGVLIGDSVDTTIKYFVTLSELV